MSDLPKTHEETLAFWVDVLGAALVMALLFALAVFA